MATVEVSIPEANLVRALNSPGGPVSNWRDETAERIVSTARVLAPVNSPLNAQHRGGFVGEYRASFDWERGHSGNQHLVRAVIMNFAPHAVYVELGRGPSFSKQTFSWTRWGGQIRTVNATRGWPGQHILERALNQVAVTAV